jgi:hypothetical protein
MCSRKLGKFEGEVATRGDIDSPKNALHPSTDDDLEFCDVIPSD